MLINHGTQAPQLREEHPSSKHEPLDLSAMCQAPQLREEHPSSKPNSALFLHLLSTSHTAMLQSESHGVQNQQPWHLIKQHLSQNFHQIHFFAQAQFSHT
ncbi:uncharacterized protein DS421_7g220690 [Arachis hypogaea]|nr:uncharacterized protein DS421_7g220690 [Arachis hypogaea]